MIIIKIYFMDNNNRYCGNRELNEGEEVPFDAVDIPVEVGDYQEAYFIDGVWIVSMIPITEPENVSEEVV